MHQLKIYIDGYTCICTIDCVKIIDSYKIDNKDIRQFLDKLEKEINHKILYRRTIDSWEEEWVAHNILYKFHLFRTRTKDVDLSENESANRIFWYRIIYKLYNKFN